MEGKLAVRIEFLNGDILADDMPTEYPAGAEDAVCLKVIQQTAMLGGYLKKGSGHSLTLCPLASMKSFTIEAPALVSADVSDLANLTMPTPWANLPARDPRR